MSSSNIKTDPTDPEDRNFLDEVRDIMRLRHYSVHTERTYCDWIKRYVNFHQMKSRDDLKDGEANIEEFLTHLAVRENVSPSTQNQAKCALVFLHKKVLKQDLLGLIDAVRAKTKKNVPVVMTREEVAKVISLMPGVPQLIVKLLYGSGLRITEAVRLRVRDINIGLKEITVRSGKGDKDRITTFPTSVIPFLKEHLEKVKILHDKDLSEGNGEVYLPCALGRKYKNAGKERQWQYVFPSANLSEDPGSGITRRHHTDPSVVNKAIKAAVKKAGIHKQISAHTFRLSFAIHLLQRGTDIRTIQRLLGHKDIEATMIYTHVIGLGGFGVISPSDDLSVEKS